MTEAQIEAEQQPRDNCNEGGCSHGVNRNPAAEETSSRIRRVGMAIV